MTDLESLRPWLVELSREVSERCDRDRQDNQRTPTHIAGEHVEYHTWGISCILATMYVVAAAVRWLIINKKTTTCIQEAQGFLVMCLRHISLAHAVAITNEPSNGATSNFTRSCALSRPTAPSIADTGFQLVKKWANER